MWILHLEEKTENSHPISGPKVEEEEEEVEQLAHDKLGKVPLTVVLEGPGMTFE
jgi:hypothetical protein